LRRRVALYRRQHGLPDKVRLTAAISNGPAIEVEDHSIARTCGGDEKLKLRSSTVLLPCRKPSSSIPMARAKSRSLVTRAG